MLEPRLPGCVLLAWYALACSASEHETAIQLGTLRYELDRELEYKVGVDVVSAMAVGESGKLVVADGWSGKVVLFSREGLEISRVGGRGSGPGEFNSISDVAIDGEDVVYVLDMNEQRVTAFVLRTHGLELGHTFSLMAFATSPPRFAYRLMATRDGALLIAYTTVSATSRDSGRTVVALLNRRGAVVRDSILVVPGEDVLRSALLGPSIAPMPYGRKPLLRLGAGDTLYYAWTGAPEIKLYDLRGRLYRSVPLPTQAPVPVTEAMVKVLMDSYREPARTIVVDAYRKGLLPATMPWFRDFVPAPDGRLWIDFFGVYDTLVATESGLEYRAPDRALRTWVVLDAATGNADGAALVPQNVRLFALRGSHAYGVVRSTLGVEEIVRFRVRRRPG